MADGFAAKHGPKKHLATRWGSACMMPGIKAENITSVHERVTCARCRNTVQYVDAVARRLVQQGRRPRKAKR
jgi:hypothetical protein